MGAQAYFEGKIVPLEQAKVSVVTHAFNYGTGCFEGIRGYWSDERKQILLFRVREHYERLHRSCRILNMVLPHSVDELVKLTAEVVVANGLHEDVYVRPLVYKSSQVVGVRLHNLDDGFLIFAVPFGNYLDVDKGISVGVSSWRRIDDNTIPARAKVTGAYINSALIRTEAYLVGYDEGISLTHDGHVSEGSGENLFLVINGKLVTPGVTENILQGITRDAIITIARNELGIETVERPVDRTELYTADEFFLCGTAAQISPVTSCDHRVVGDGEIGPSPRSFRSCTSAWCEARRPRMLTGSPASAWTRRDRRRRYGCLVD